MPHFQLKPFAQKPEGTHFCSLENRFRPLSWPWASLSPTPNDSPQISTDSRRCFQNSDLSVATHVLVLRLKASVPTSWLTAVSKMFFVSSNLMIMIMMVIYGDHEDEEEDDDDDDDEDKGYYTGRDPSWTHHIFRIICGSNIKVDAGIWWTCWAAPTVENPRKRSTVWFATVALWRPPFAARLPCSQAFQRIDGKDQIVLTCQHANIWMFGYLEATTYT